MTQEQERKLDTMAEQVGAIHTTLFGVEGQGGIHRRVERLESHREEMTAFKAKMLGMVTGASLLASFAGTKIAAFFRGPTN